MPAYSSFKYNTKKYNAQGDNFFTFLDKKRDAKPVVRLEFVDRDGVATDISRYYDEGANVERIKERAPDEIQSGDFDLVVFNHDDTFSEYKVGSLLHGIVYHGAKIRIWIGFKLSNGTIEYKLQQVGYIDELRALNDSRVTFRCRDALRRILDEKMNSRTDAETPVPGGANVGDGTCSPIATKPFKTKNETWTLTCTTPGDDSVAQFSVVGSVSGSVGPATSGTEFSTGNGAGGIRFTIRAGDVVWSAGDTITFETFQYPEWTLANPAKIIWGVLTGTNFDTGAAEPWASRVLDLDGTLSSANTELDYDSFASVAAEFGAADFITGYASHEEDVSEFIQTILITFLGAVFTIGDGRIRLQSFQPVFGQDSREFADSKKITNFTYRRAVSEILNSAIVLYKATDVWEFSDEDVNLDGIFSALDQESVDQHGLLVFNNGPYELRWFSPSGTHARDFVERLILKYKQPPLVVDFETGSDGIMEQIGNKIKVTDEKAGLTSVTCEISRISKMFDARPLKVAITGRRDGDLELFFGFLGSRVDEGDSMSPQASTFGAATDADKQFCYLTNGYRMY